MSTRRYSDMKAGEEAASSENLVATPGTKAVPHKKSRVSDSPLSSRSSGPRMPLHNISLNATNNSLIADPNESSGSEILGRPSIAARGLPNVRNQMKPLFDDLSIDDSTMERIQPGRSLFDEIKEENPDTSMFGDATAMYDTLNFDDNRAEQTLDFFHGDFSRSDKTPEPEEPEDKDPTFGAGELEVEVNGEIVVAEMSMLNVTDNSGNEVKIEVTAKVQQVVADVPAEPEKVASDVVNVEVEKESSIEIAEEAVEVVVTVSDEVKEEVKIDLQATVEAAEPVKDVLTEVSENTEPIPTVAEEKVAALRPLSPAEKETSVIADETKASATPVEAEVAAPVSIDAETTKSTPNEVEVSESTPKDVEDPQSPPKEAEVAASTPEEAESTQTEIEMAESTPMEAEIADSTPAETESTPMEATLSSETPTEACESAENTIQPVETAQPVLLSPLDVLPIVPIQLPRNITDEAVAEAMDITACSIVLPSEDRPTTPNEDLFLTPKTSPVVEQAPSSQGLGVSALSPEAQSRSLGVSALSPEAQASRALGISALSPAAGSRGLGISAMSPDVSLNISRGLGVNALSPDVSLSVSRLGFNMDSSDQSFFTSHRTNVAESVHKTLNFDNSQSSMDESGSPRGNDSLVSFLGHEIKVHANLDQAAAMRSVAELQQKSASETNKLRMANEELYRQLLQKNEIETRLKLDLEHARKDSDDWKLLYEELTAKAAKQRHHMKPIQDEALMEQIEELKIKLVSENTLQEEYRRETMQLRQTLGEMTVKLQDAEHNVEKAAELKSLQEELDTMRLRFEGLEETAQQYVETIAIFEDKEVQLNDLITDLQKDIESKNRIEEHLKNLNSQLAANGIEDISSVMKKLETVTKELAEKNAAVDEMFTEIHNLKRANRIATDNLEDMKEELAQAKTAAASVQFVESASEVDADALKTAVDEAAAFKTQLEAANSEIAALKTYRDTVATEMDGVKKRCLELMELEANKQENPDLAEKTVQLEDIVARLQSKLDDVAEQKAKQASTHLATVDDLNSKHAAELETLRATVAHYEVALKEQEGEVSVQTAELKSTIEKLKAELAAATESQNALTAEKVTLTSEIQEVNAKVAQLEEALREKESEMAVTSDLGNQVAAKDAELSELRMNLNASEELLKDLQAQLAEKDTKFAEVEREFNAVSDKLAATAVDGDLLKNKTAELEQKTAEIEKLQQDLAAASTEIAAFADVQQSLDKLVAESMQKDAQLVAIQQALDDANAKLTADVERLTTFEAAIVEKDTKIEELQQSLSASSANQQRLGELVAEVSQKEDQLATMQKEFDAKYAALLADHDTMKSLTESQVTALQDTVNKMATELADVKKRETDQFAEQEAELNGLKAVTADLRQRVELLMAQKAELEVERQEALSKKAEAEQLLEKIRVDLEEQFQVKENDLTNIVNSLKAELETKATLISGLETEVERYREKVLDLETNTLEQTISFPPTAPITDKIREAVAATFNPIRAELQEKNHKLINEKAELQTQLTIVQDKYSRGKAMFAQLKADRDVLREQLRKRAAVAEASTITDEIEMPAAGGDSDKVQSLEAEIVKYKADIEKLTDELDTMDEVSNAYRDKAHKLTVEMNQLKTRLGDTNLVPVTTTEE